MHFQLVGKKTKGCF